MYVLTEIRCRTSSTPLQLSRDWSVVYWTQRSVQSIQPRQHRSTFNKLCGRPPQYAPVPCKLTFDLLILKVVSESHATWATSVPILVFLGLSVLDLGPMYATDRPTDVRRASSLNASALWRRGITNFRLQSMTCIDIF